MANEENVKKDTEKGTEKNDAHEDSVEEGENKENDENKPPSNEGDEENLSNASTELKDDKDRLIGDIMANNPIQAPENEEEEKREFSKKDVLDEVGFSFLNLNVWLSAQFPTVPDIWKVLFEILFVTSAFLILPMLSLYIEFGRDSRSQLKNIFVHKDAEVGDLIRHVQHYIFITVSYVIYVIISYIADNILYIALSILTFLRIEINELIVELLQVTKATSSYSSMSLICFIIFYAYSNLVKSYEFMSKDRSTEHIILTALLWYGFLMAMTFVEKFVMNFCTSEIRRIEFRNRIWDINYKMFIFKKLVAISTASESERKSIGEAFEADYDPGFFLKHNDLKLNSEENAKNVAESIFAYLEITKITYEDIKMYFPDNYDEVFNYLSSKKFKDDEERPDISYEDFENKAVFLYTERNDMSRTLADRESIFNKLDLILFSLCFYLSLIIFAVLMDIDYKVYLASVGPFVFGVSWVFSDTIKEIYNCFVFLLVSHPYDVGDRVLIDNVEYLVQKTDLLSTTFVDLNGKLAYIPNPSLFNKKIENIRRSSKQSDLLTIKVDASTTFKAALGLRDKIQKKLQSDKDHFTGLIYLLKFEVDGDSVALGYLIQHKENFQKMPERFKRRDKLTALVEEAIKEANIGYKNSFAYIS
ncbi:Mechanosensitive ion channel protein 9 [Nosema granulosis]|uniref:Mechanosensitive ion channel protein 9 n=1 Tax=Nosema granulosis TaxID=83296 RepID=A0A9P6H3D9_9MICR|nr:Mechanosensitive ion channel protein 9 [Nosema granulosis]